MRPRNVAPATNGDMPHLPLTLLTLRAAQRDCKCCYAKIKRIILLQFLFMIFWGGNAGGKSILQVGKASSMAVNQTLDANLIGKDVLVGVRAVLPGDVRQFYVWEVENHNKNT